VIGITVVIIIFVLLSSMSSPEDLRGQTGIVSQQTATTGKPALLQTEGTKYTWHTFSSICMKEGRTMQVAYIQ